MKLYQKQRDSPESSIEKNLLRRWRETESKNDEESETVIEVFMTALVYVHYCNRDSNRQGDDKTNGFLRK